MGEIYSNSKFDSSRNIWATTMHQALFSVRGGGGAAETRINYIPAFSEFISYKRETKQGTYFEIIYIL